jgi:LPS-assembly protein
MRLSLSLAVSLAILSLHVRAQQPLPESTTADRQNRVGENHFKFVGHFEYERGDVKMYADEAEYFKDDHRLILTGNVVLRQGANQIAADRADFDTETRLGTFFSATGFATLKPQRQPPPRPGVAAPPAGGQQPNTVFFFGDSVEKIGPKKYKITAGGFTTCVQPTPRWDLHADTVILNVDHYTLLRNAVLTAKGVPMLYLPIMYYPTKREDRATGFLLPTYGVSSLRGQSVHNAFFWAIDRSQDATVMHDWFSKTGQGVGTEYRYNFGGGSDGTISSYFLNEHPTTTTLSNGQEGSTSGSRSYKTIANVNQPLPGGFRARAQANYFSNLITNQTFDTNVFSTTNSQRSFGGNIVGTVQNYSVNATLMHTESFYNATDSTIIGTWPQLNVSRSERPLGGSDVYFTMAGEYARLLQESKAPSAGVDTDLGLARLDARPQLRYPFKKWQWFTVNSTAAIRDTYYSRSLDDGVTDSAGAPCSLSGTCPIVDRSLNRFYFAGQAQMLGPVFNRIWDTPDNRYAEKFKHTVGPYLNLQYTSPIADFDRIVKSGTDVIVGGVQYNYGVNNRFYAKRRSATPGQPSLSREILDVEVTQTYYTNQSASQFDPRYVSSLNTPPRSNFSPVGVNVRGMPTIDVNATLHAEFDSRYHSLRTISANGSYAWSGRVQTTVGWSKQPVIPQLVIPGTTPPNPTEFVNVTSNVHTKDNRVGTIYSFNYDVVNAYFPQQRISAFYNAQCCGIAMEYQTYNFGNGLISSLIPPDHRFFLSFTLAGLGNFSPFNGALGGVPR